MSRGVVILKIGENRGNIRNIFGIKYKILLSSKFKNNIPYKLNIICEIRFLEIIFTIQEIIRKSKVNSILKIFFSTGKEIIPKLYGPEEQGGPTFHKVSFSCPTCRLSCSAVVRPRHTALETRPRPITNLPRSSCYYSIKYQKAAKGVEGMVKGERE